jgi:hypothetical protein
MWRSWPGAGGAARVAPAGRRAAAALRAELTCARGRRFRGAIEIESRSSAPTPVVWLNARFLQIDSARIDGHRQQCCRRQDFIGLRPEAPLAPGRTAIRIEYRGELSDGTPSVRSACARATTGTSIRSLSHLRAARVPLLRRTGYKVPWQLLSSFRR